MGEISVLLLMLGLGGLLFFLFIILVIILVFKIPDSLDVKRNVRDEVRKIKEQIEHSEE